MMSSNEVFENSASLVPVGVLEKASILVVDDDPYLREVITTFLVEEGASVVGAAGGDEAFLQLQKHKVDLVISDMRMPAGSGKDLLCAMKQDAALKNLPVIIVTGYADFNARDLISLGAKTIVPKPFTLEVLLQAIQQCRPQI